MHGKMMDVPLLVSEIIDHAALCYGEVEIVARQLDGSILRYDYAAARRRALKLAQALIRLGVAPGERVGALAWNTHHYFEMFYGVSGPGAVLHTINPRLFDEQLTYIINHAEDAYLFVDAGTLELAERLAPTLNTVRGFVFMGDAANMPSSRLPGIVGLEDLLAAEDGNYEWPILDERQASTICYTSGTTGNPKGVVYSHRSAVLTAMMGSMQDFIGGHRSGMAEVYMPLAPLFHGNGWQTPYAAPMCGFKLVLPGRHYEPEKLYELIEGEGVTVAYGVPTIWLMLVDYLKTTGKRFTTLRAALMSGAKPPRSLIETLARDYDVDGVNVWGMTEALGAAKATLRPGLADLPFEERINYKMRQGRIAFGTRFRIVDDEGNPLPWDGKTNGHLQVQGPIIASGYLKEAEGVSGATGVVDGWLHTGDVAALHADGYIELSDRSKDVIKSGGEWISSVEVENAAMGHPGVMEAAVIGVDHPKWQERPLLIVVRRPTARVSREEILDYLGDKIARWWVPDDVVFVDELPHTATGKVHKLTLRERFGDHKLPDAAAAGGRS